MGKNKLHVLKGINLEITEGEFVAIMGSSGSGKSTLLNIIGMLDEHDTGIYELDGVRIEKLNETKAANYRNKFLGFIFQSYNLISFKNVLENVALPLYYQKVKRSDRNKIALSYLERVGLEPWATHMPNELSGGQKQRVAIARALASNPTLLLCDEATSALDPATTKSILNLLKEINQKLNLTILLITHEMEVINRICDEVGVIDDGILVEHGSVEDVFTNPKEDITKEFITNSLDLSLPTFFEKNISASKQENAATIYKLSFTNLQHFLA